MKQQYQKLKSATIQKNWPKWVRFSLRALVVLILLQVVFFISLFWYINSHKQQVLAMVTENLNENLNGTISIQSMEPTFFGSFPRISLHLRKVILRDTMFAAHQKTFLQAEDFDIAINTLAFIRGTVEINKINISNATVNLFTAIDGYSNANIFKTKQNVENDDAAYPELKKFELQNVSFTIDNQRRHKLFQFVIRSIDGKMNFDADNWTAALHVNALVKSLAFSTLKGSFIKEKTINGDLQVAFEAAKKRIIILPNTMDIGGEEFTIAAEFQKTTANTNDYVFHIVNDEILWKNASHLLTPNIYSRLDRFNLKNPIGVRCDISGNFDEEGDPFILVNAKIKDNEIDTPGGLLTNCSFTGIFTNNYVRENGYNDANSGILFQNFEGQYAGMPIRMKQAAILNLENPIAKGDFKSTFPLEKLGNIIDPQLFKFTKGTADVDLIFNADIINYTLTKPIVTGTVAVNEGTVEYAPRKLRFSKASVLLEFKNDDLLISNIHVQSGRSSINMEGKIGNFLNLYYTAPEKVVLNWKINSPEIHLAEFIEFLSARKVTKTPSKKKRKNADFTDDLNLLFDKCQVTMSLRVEKLLYHKFIASRVRADLLLANSQIILKNGGLLNSGGIINFKGMLQQMGKVNRYEIQTEVNHVDVSKFFYAFDNFGMQSMQYNNLTGQLSARSGLSGKILDNGQLVPNTILGNVDFELNDGALLNFDPIRKIGKYAFPNRNLNRITFQDLAGKLVLAGDKVTIRPMQINTSLLNMDIEGLYSFGTGTSINISLPLRNPEKDKNISDPELLAKRRERGLVLRLQATDGQDNKVKIKLVSKKTQLEEKKSTD